MVSSREPGKVCVHQIVEIRENFFFRRLFALDITSVRKAERHTNLKTTSTLPECLVVHFKLKTILEDTFTLHFVFCTFSFISIRNRIKSVKNPFFWKVIWWERRGGGHITRRIRRTHARQRAACNLMKYLSSCVIIISDWTQAINYFANWCHSFREADPVHRIQCSCTFFTPSLWCLVSPWRFVSTSIFILPHLLKERLNSNNKTLTFS